MQPWKARLLGGVSLYASIVPFLLVAAEASDAWWPNLQNLPQVRRLPTSPDSRRWAFPRMTRAPAKSPKLDQHQRLGSLPNCGRWRGPWRKCGRSECRNGKSRVEPPQYGRLSREDRAEFTQDVDAAAASNLSRNVIRGHRGGLLSSRGTDLRASSMPRLRLAVESRGVPATPIEDGGPQVASRPPPTEPGNARGGRQ